MTSGNLHTMQSLLDDESAPEAVKELATIINKTALGLQEYLPAGMEVMVAAKFPDVEGGAMFASTEDSLDGFYSDMTLALKTLHGGSQ